MPICPVDLYLAIDASASFSAHCLLVRDALIRVLLHPEIDVALFGLQITCVKFRGQAELEFSPASKFQTKEDIVEVLRSFDCSMPNIGSDGANAIRKLFVDFNEMTGRRMADEQNRTFAADVLIMFTDAKFYSYPCIEAEKSRENLGVHTVRVSVK